MDHLRLREVAGAFATGVTVVTITKPDGEVHGMTANSFLSVSLDPPLILFSVQNDASLWNLLELDGHVGLSILRESQLDYSRHFAGDETEVEIAFEEKEEVKLIRNCLAWYATRITEMVPAGDHTLVICEVLECARRTGKPLLYYSGYRYLSSENGHDEQDPEN